MTDSDEFTLLVQQAREHLDRLDGTLLPEFVKVPDGHYDRRIVLDEPVIADWVAAGVAVPEHVLAFHYEAYHAPRYRTEVRWTAALSGRTEGSDA